MDRAPFLDDEQVALYPIEPDDAPFLRDLNNHPDVRAWIDHFHPSSTEYEADWITEHVVEGDWVVLLVAPADGDEPVGVVMLRPDMEIPRIGELGVMILPAHQRNGYGGAALRLLVDYAFRELDYHKLWAWALADNDASITMLDGLGFQREGVKRAHAYRDGSYADTVQFGMLKEEWRER